MDARSLEKADEERRKAIDAAIAAYHLASAEAGETYHKALRQAEADYKKALEPIKKAFKEAREKADRELEKRMSW